MGDLTFVTARPGDAFGLIENRAQNLVFGEFGGKFAAAAAQDVAASLRARADVAGVVLRTPDEGLAELRAAGVAAELYLGRAGMKAQMKYADRRMAPAAIMLGGDEIAAGKVTIKDLDLGRALSAGVTDNAPCSCGAKPYTVRYRPSACTSPT